MSKIKDMVKDKMVTFLFYKENELWYTTECGFEFPVAIDDVGTAAMNATDKALLFMRWIRKELDRQAEFAMLREQTELSKEDIDDIVDASNAGC